MKLPRPAQACRFPFEFQWNSGRATAAGVIWRPYAKMGELQVSPKARQVLRPQLICLPCNQLQYCRAPSDGQTLADISLCELETITKACCKEKPSSTFRNPKQTCQGLNLDVSCCSSVAQCDLTVVSIFLRNHLTSPLPGARIHTAEGLISCAEQHQHMPTGDAASTGSLQQSQQALSFQQN